MVEPNSIVVQFAAISIAFLVGWLAASQATRTIVFKRKFIVYQKLNKLAAAVLLASITYERNPEAHRPIVAQRRIKLMNFVAANTLILSENTSPLLSPILEPSDPPDVNDIREAFNALVRQMSKELKLDSIHSINGLLHK